MDEIFQHNNMQQAYLHQKKSLLHYSTAFLVFLTVVLYLKYRNGPATNRLLKASLIGRYLFTLTVDTYLTYKTPEFRMPWARHVKEFLRD